ncbi:MULTISPECIES: tyrosine-type recombinase/integrase [unclassified Rhodococcus (in: high G+C Gram-positive bacteria)]|uniref:tyrosine-type recombinase/integrase n=1 Tax=unclassified Rhodococcus (in: high G+C Gram-positive bacteria) TaxID=192944 RepID=UPI001639A58D|nr:MULTISPECIES: tyrosine-type recombinase/integrase [unclassified Rhodococcus (in: high G+C Gram-positive bacteria)]MBC2640752.1 tyrosine-type recombinase/integrase [Rhodococcus sp. 3A]MBC2641949.1 tyrosine-type recombinase/integrase [Rhodococcus sp. 3A]MBC2893310.1 tyrosine-type recombinase/integrase [Rhodococcus sp. 4CII]MBC2894503.1 tyrosine-type recombinase/integrase [Rhodococcus sp. 4CII]MBC2897410.1 tyrosine-type recombinase/integrase [Rhodococcus sp. 4CII]
MTMMMNSQTAPSVWEWPLRLDRFRRHGRLSKNESDALQTLGFDLLRLDREREHPQWQAIARLTAPLDEAIAALHWHPDTVFQRRFARYATAIVLHRCGELGRDFWSWSTQEWAELLRPQQLRERFRGQVGMQARPYLLVHAYLLTGFTAFDLVGPFARQTLAQRIFGSVSVDQAVEPVRAVLNGWGYRAANLESMICTLLLLNRSPMLNELTSSALDRLRADAAIERHFHGRHLHGVHRALATLGHTGPPPAPRYGDGPVPITGTAPGWAQAVERWHATATVQPSTRDTHRVVLAKIGRWLAADHPDITGPADWTRQTCSAWIAAVDRMHVGDHIQSESWRESRIEQLGKPLSAKTKRTYIRIVRTFFRDIQDWDWIPRRFDPARALETPRSIRALQGPDPRVIADDLWAKLLWAGLNLDPGDLPAGPGAHPVDMVRAVTLTWLFAGQRSDEIARLRVGCIRWQHDQPAVVDDRQQTDSSVCLLDIPTHKTGTAFTKPVDPLLGRAIEAWQALRPAQPPMLDRKTGEKVHFLFAVRAGRISKNYINDTIIPALCRKADIPAADVRGPITSHRARSTIATQLYNAKEPMTLFELQAWLGHRSPESTQHYARITPNTLAKAYNDAGYFARNVRTIEVLVDRDAATSGAAAVGEPWQHYDLGHGFCSYTFFEQCPHRMACARCDFYIPKESSKSELLQAKSNLQRMLVSIPLTDDEQAAVEDGQAALDQLLQRLADVPTPAGTTPRQLTATPLPIVAVNHGRPART